MFLCLCLPAMPAQAQEPGVTIDPNSPAGAEYALPFDQARDTGARGSQGAGSGGPGSQPFGVGIGRSEGPPPPPGVVSGVESGGSGTSAGAAGGADEAAGSARSTPSDGAQPARAAQHPSSTASLSVTPAGGAGSTLMVIAGAVAVLLAGSSLGLLARRRRVTRASV